jgi:hypothetical protein
MQAIARLELKQKTSQSEVFCLFNLIDVTQNADNESLAASQAGQPRGDCPYLNNLCSVGDGRTGRSPKLQLSQEFYLRKVVDLTRNWNFNILFPFTCWASTTNIAPDLGCGNRAISNCDRDLI